MLYTDGLVERSGETFDAGVDALCAALADADRSAPDLAHRLVQVLHPAERQRDDLAVVTLHVDYPVGSVTPFAT